MSDDGKRVFHNKVLGEPFEPKTREVDTASMRALICVKRRANDPEFYLRGQVPPGVRFLTAGQDSRTTELHWAVWGWGLRRRIDQTTALCAWLIDWGIVPRRYSLTFETSEYHVFDSLLYRRLFPSTVSDRNFMVHQGGHDIGYQPTQIPIISYVRSWPNRAFAIKGASETASSAVRADYMRLGSAIAVKLGDETIRDAATQPWLCNTYQLKCEWFGMFDRRIEVLDTDGSARTVPLITLPEDVDDTFIDQSCSEFLAPGERESELVWKHKGPNHYADCTTYAHGLALNLNPGQLDQTEAEASAPVPEPRPAPREEREDPSYS